jgi:hypothetical protein
MQVGWSLIYHESYLASIAMCANVGSTKIPVCQVRVLWRPLKIEVPESYCAKHTVLEQPPLSSTGETDSQSRVLRTDDL